MKPLQNIVRKTRKIAICDDEPVFVQAMAECIHTILSGRQLEYEIVCYENSSKFAQVCEQEIFHIVILDIDMPELSGFQIAKKIMEKSKQTLLIFCTSHNELVYDSFTYQPFWFIRKENYTEILESVLVRADKKVSALEQNWNIEIKGELHCLSLPQIIYIDSYQHKVYIHLEDGTYVSYRDNLSAVEKKLEKAGFIRISSGCIINMRWIKHVKQSEIILKKDKLPMFTISREKASAVRQALHQYLRVGV